MPFDLPWLFELDLPDYPSTIEEKIEAALFMRMLSFAIGEDQLPISWPNIEFPAPDEDKPATYIEVRQLPNRSTRFFLKGSDPHLRQGILQLTVMTPLRVGPQPATQIGGLLVEHFPADLDLFQSGVRVRIQQAPDVLDPAPTDDGVSWSARVDVRYECLA